MGILFYIIILYLFCLDVHKTSLWQPVFICERFALEKVFRTIILIENTTMKCFIWIRILIGFFRFDPWSGDPSGSDPLQSSRSTPKILGIVTRTTSLHSRRKNDWRTRISLDPRRIRDDTETQWISDPLFKSLRFIPDKICQPPAAEHLSKSAAVSADQRTCSAETCHPIFDQVSTSLIGNCSKKLDRFTARATVPKTKS